VGGKLAGDMSLRVRAWFSRGRYTLLSRLSPHGRGLSAGRNLAMVSALAICSSLAVSSVSLDRPASKPASHRTAERTSLPALGVNINALQLPASLWSPAMRLFRQAGASWIRVDALWNIFEPSPGVYDQSYLKGMNAIVSRAHSLGLNVLFTVLGTPLWDQPANKAGSSGAELSDGTNLPPVDVAAYGAALKVLAKNFAGRPVAWELWNEPNYSQFLSTMDPVVYTKLACSAYRAIKSVAPHATVVAGALSGADSDWLRAAYYAGLHGCFDVISIHPYDWINGPVPPDWQPPVYAGNVRQVMDKNGDSSKPIWVTEFGWYADPASSAPVPAGGVTLQEQAAYTQRWISLVGSSYPYINVVIVYNGIDGPSNPYVDEAWAGILTVNLHPKPVYLALKSMYQR
jgi:polysaccharide biosynthesis protein PslG